MIKINIRSGIVISKRASYTKSQESTYIVNLRPFAIFTSYCSSSRIFCNNGIIDTSSESSDSSTSISLDTVTCFVVSKLRTSCLSYESSYAFYSTVSLCEDFITSGWLCDIILSSYIATIPEHSPDISRIGFNFNISFDKIIMDFEIFRWTTIEQSYETSDITSFNIEIYT